MTSDNMTGEHPRDRIYRTAWLMGDGRRPCHSQTYIHQSAAEGDRDETAAEEYVTKAWVEVAEWRRLDSPEPSDAERVEAVHQRMHEASPRIFSFDTAPSTCPEVAQGVPCRLLSLAYAALDVDDPTLTEMPWRAK